jgi:hypothetical protein
MDRRTFLTATAAAAAAPLAAGPADAAATNPPLAKATERLDKLAAAAAAARLPMAFDGKQFAGAGYDWLLKRGREAHAFLIGEEHGIAENPKLAAQLFGDLAPHAYRYVAVEVSPPMADALERALASGDSALRRLLTAPESRVPFFGMREEADWLSAVRPAAPRNRPFLWGLDYDVAADRYLLARLHARPKPIAAAQALDELAAASAGSWARYEETRNPQFVFSFSGHPALVEAVEQAWPRRDAESRTILHTLRETLAINQLWGSGKGYESNLRRSQLMRANLLRYWEEKERFDPDGRVLMKMGASHLVRGVNMSDVFDLGTLVPELTGARGRSSFHMLVLPGPTSQTANLDPTRFVYVPGKRDEYGEGMDIFDKAVLPDGFTLFDTTPLRPIASSSSGEVPLPLWRVIHGFDAVLVMTGSTPSSNL